MRQVVDTLVWLAMILVIAAVVYFTPRLANYVTSMSGGQTPDYLSSTGDMQLTTYDNAIETR